MKWAIFYLAAISGAELGFMSCLYSQEGKASQIGNELGARYFHQEHLSFFREHLTQWLPQFAERVAKRSNNPVYRTLASLLHNLVAREGR